MTIKESRRVDMVDYLLTLGYSPDRIRNNNYWFHSPLRTERTPSFKINRSINKWHDFRDGQGGDLLDFIIAYYHCSLSEALQKFEENPISAYHQGTAIKNHAAGLEITGVTSLTSVPLIEYLKERRINYQIALQYLSQVYFNIGAKCLYSLGFANDKGGYELRNAFFKGSSSPKSSTFMDRGESDLNVFEGCFDFLSYLTITVNQDLLLPNFLILNSTALFEKNLPIMQRHETVNLFLDNDDAGEKIAVKAIALNPGKFTDHRNLYRGYKDVNDWLRNIRKLKPANHRLPDRE